MNIAPEESRRLLSSIAATGNSLSAVYRELPLIRTKLAPNWTGDTAFHFDGIMYSYNRQFKRFRADLDGVSSRLKHAIDCANRIESLFGN